MGQLKEWAKLKKIQPMGPRKNVRCSAEKIRQKPKVGDEMAERIWSGVQKEVGMIEKERKQEKRIGNEIVKGKKDSKKVEKERIDISEDKEFSNWDFDEEEGNKKMGRKIEEKWDNRGLKRSKRGEFF